MANQTLGGLPILQGMYQNPPTHIPDGNGGSYKTEFALLRSSERTEKILWWHADDPRSDDPTRQYHNHPWPFQSTILSGGYSEHRYWIKENGSLGYELATYRQGDVNVVHPMCFTLFLMSSRGL